MSSQVVNDAAHPVTPQPRRMPLAAYRLAIIVPTIGWLTANAARDPAGLADPMLLMWIVAIAGVDLLPLPVTANLHFSLSFPVQLAVAVIYSPVVAGAVTLVGTSDLREVRGEITFLQGLFNRAQVAASVIVECWVFHQVAELDAAWYLLLAAVLLTTVVGYLMNVVLVAVAVALHEGETVDAVVRRMHQGIFGELIVSYTGLALFGVVIANFFVREGIWSIVIFLAPLAFARQMFARTHSLKLATQELEIRQKQQEHQALHDALTGLPNRLYFMNRLQAAIDESRDGNRVAVLIMDLDQFKEINDSLGHQYGDLLLQEVAPRLQSMVRDGDTVARLGGDEFGVLLPRISDPRRALEVAQRILDVLEAPVLVEGLALAVSASIGIGMYPDHSSGVDTLLRLADVAMYSAKEARSGYELYSPELDMNNPARVALVGQIRPAIEDEQLTLFYQPQAEFGTGRIRGFEALLRWEHPTQGLIMPGRFIELAERTVLLRPLTMYVLDTALRQCSEWRASGHELMVAVNVSPRSLLDAHLPHQVESLLQRWGVPARLLQLEITEGSLGVDSVRSADVLSRLSGLGVSFAIDDFGTGYSSLAYLKRLSVHEIKIDRSFVMNMVQDPSDATIVRATVDLAHHLGLFVTAEGVETEEAWRRLAAIGCDVAQGYLLGRPMPGDQVLTWLRERDPWVQTSPGPAPLAVVSRS